MRIRGLALLRLCSRRGKGLCGRRGEGLCSCRGNGLCSSRAKALYSSHGRAPRPVVNVCGETEGRTPHRGLHLCQAAIPGVDFTIQGDQRLVAQLVITTRTRFPDVGERRRNLYVIALTCPFGSALERHAIVGTVAFTQDAVWTKVVVDTGSGLERALLFGGITAGDSPGIERIKNRCWCGGWGIRGGFRPGPTSASQCDGGSPSSGIPLRRRGRRRRRGWTMGRGRDHGAERRGKVEGAGVTFGATGIGTVWFAGKRISTSQRRRIATNDELEDAYPVGPRCTRRCYQAPEGRARRWSRWALGRRVPPCPHLEERMP